MVDFGSECVKIQNVNHKLFFSYEDFRNTEEDLNDPESADEGDI
jgi:hypothetical protein